VHGPRGFRKAWVGGSNPFVGSLIPRVHVMCAVNCTAASTPSNTAGGPRVESRAEYAATAPKPLRLVPGGAHGCLCVYLSSSVPGVGTDAALARLRRTTIYRREGRVDGNV
jgi:hypothetical protein